jgi:ribonuclease III
MGFIRRIFNKYFASKEEIIFAKQLEEVLGYVPSNLEFYALAFAYKSYGDSHEKYYDVQNNERLEFLGDAVLGTIVAEYLFNKYPNSDEGFLTKMRSKCVNRKMLNHVGKEMGLEEFIDISDANKMSKSTLGNALEAFIGAIYLDIGYYGTQEFIIHRMLKHFINVEHLEIYDDNFKSQLLEWCQKNKRSISYEIVNKTKVDNRDFFKIAVKIDNVSAGEADDFNKKSAEQKASKIAMEKLKIPIQPTS